MISLSRPSVNIFLAPLILIISLSACASFREDASLCSANALIDAIHSANNSPDETLIALEPGCTYLLTEEDNNTDGANGLPSISTQIIIRGGPSTIQRASTSGPSFRIFHISPEGVLTLENVTVRGGAAVAERIFDIDERGGGIYNGGSLIVFGSSISHNIATQGGGIYNLGTLIVNNGSSMTTNGAESFFGKGGGIYNNQGEVTIDDSSISGNTSAGVGAGIYSYRGSVAISTSDIIDNIANTFGGGIFTSGALSIVDSTISGNTGEGIHNSGRLEVRRSTINNNEGGGILNNIGCAATIEHSVISNNGSSGISNKGALTLAFSTLSGNREIFSGGGIRNQGELFINKSTLADNSAGSKGGGVYNLDFGSWSESPGYIGVASADSIGEDAGTLCGQEITTGVLVISNSTLSGNSASRGGGLFNDYGGEVSVIYSTLTSNTSGRGGGGIFDESEGFGSIEFINSIVANSTRGGDCAIAPGVIMTMGNNLDSDGSCEGFSMTADPALGALEYNGGRTATHALLEGSPAIDAASGTCPTVDQRSILRPFGDYCDLGAYESAGGATSLEVPLIPSPTPSLEPLATALQNASCRKDADPAFEVHNFLFEGESAQVIGRMPEGNWFYVELPNELGQCWIFGENLELAGPIDGLPFLTSPELPAADEDDADEGGGDDAGGDSGGGQQEEPEGPEDCDPQTEYWSDQTNQCETLI